MPQRSRWLEGLLARAANFPAPRHRNLVRAIQAELESIEQPAERRRFAWGALLAIARLSLTGRREALLNRSRRLAAPPDNLNSTNRGGGSMPALSTRQLIGRHAVPFGLTFVMLTGLLLARSANQLWLQVSARTNPSAVMLEALWLALPSIVALTIPMSVFIAVAWVFTRLGREGVLAASMRERHGIRRLIRPVAVAAALVAAFTLVSNVELLPRANGRYTALLTDRPVAPSDRSMTIGELREAARQSREQASIGAPDRASAYGVEIQKKFALAAACLFLALTAAALGMRFPRGGVGFVLLASVVVFCGYYLLVIGGEALADQRVIPPTLGMWAGNGLLFGATILLLWRTAGADAQPPQTMACDG